MNCDENFRYIEKGRYYILGEYLKKREQTEFTVWLLEYKQRDLGFDLGDGFDL